MRIGENAWKNERKIKSTANAMLVAVIRLVGSEFLEFIARRSFYRLRRNSPGPWPASPATRRMLPDVSQEVSDSLRER
jgi:hypothetical protein